MNILNKSAIRSCTSCQMCAAVCPKNAISVICDNEGFYRPSIELDRCVDCSLCVDICYKFEKNIAYFGKEKLAETILYGASAKDDEIVKNTTSGGIADILSHELMSKGYKCVGVVYDSERDIAKDCIAEGELDLENFRGSKYIQSYTVNAFKEIVKNCTKQKYAVFGTPCHIFALDRYLRKRKVRDNFILIDLYCHGCPSLLIWSKYVKDIKKQINQSRIENVNFRSKIKGWGFYYLVMEGGGKTYSSKENVFFDLFFCDQVLNKACNDCVLRGTLQYTDIRLGDFWGKKYVLNTRGVSAVSLVSKKAKLLFENMANKVDYQDESYEDFLPWQSWGKCYYPDENLRQMIMDMLQSEETQLQDVIKAIHIHRSLKQKLICYVKKLVQSLPVSLEKRVRWLFYKLSS